MKILAHISTDVHLTDNFTVIVASKPEEIKVLLGVGFEYICEKDDPFILPKTQVNMKTE